MQGALTDVGRLPPTIDASCRRALRHFFLDMSCSGCLCASHHHLSAGGTTARHAQVLLVVLAKPPLTSDEVKWKKGVRQDNRVKPRKGEMLKKARERSAAAAAAHFAPPPLVAHLSSAGRAATRPTAAFV